MSKQKYQNKTHKQSANKIKKSLEKASKQRISGDFFVQCFSVKLFYQSFIFYYFNLYNTIYMKNIAVFLQ